MDSGDGDSAAEPPQLFPRRVVFNVSDKTPGFTVDTAGTFVHLCSGSPPAFGTTHRAHRLETDRMGDR